MTAYQYNRSGARDLSAFLATTGTEIDPTPNGGTITLPSSSTYYVPFGDDVAPMPSEASLAGIHIKWNSAFVGVLTIETSNFPSKRGGGWIGQFDVTDYDTTPGNWIQENPSTAYISVTSTDGSTGNAVVANATITVSGGTAGGCMIHIGNIGSRRARIKVAVTTGGVLRFSGTGKNAA